MFIIADKVGAAVFHAAHSSYREAWKLLPGSMGLFEVKGEGTHDNDDTIPRQVCTGL